MDLAVAPPRDAARVLDAAENARWSRFRREAPRRAFLASRWALRRLLALYTGVAPDEVRIEIDVDGKPGAPETALHFNLSHSHELALVALAVRPVGVDVEQVRRVRDAERLASRFLAPTERAAVAAAPDPDRAFLRCWTLKEALLKARGSGLTQSLSSFSVDAAADPPVVHWIDRPSQEPDWQLRRLEVCDGYVGALATLGELTEIRSARLPG